MARTDVLSGFVTLSVVVNAIRKNPQGHDVYPLEFSMQMTDADTIGTAGNGQVFSAFHEIVTVTNSSTTFSLADYVDPLATLGSNNWASDPEGGIMKVLVFKNLSSPTDGTGKNIFVGFNDGSINDMLGPVVTYSTGAAAPSGAALKIGPGGCHAFFDPTDQMLGSPITDGVDDEIKVVTNSGTAQLELLMVVG